MLDVLQTHIPCKGPEAILAVLTLGRVAAKARMQCLPKREAVTTVMAVEISRQNPRALVTLTDHTQHAHDLWPQLDSLRRCLQTWSVRDKLA